MADEQQRRNDRGRNKGGAPKGGRQRGAGGGTNRRPQPGDDVAALGGPLAQVLSRLPATQRRVLELRMGLVDGHPANLSDTAKAMGMTMHEAKMVEQRAFEHIREAIPTAHLKKMLERLS